MATEYQLLQAGTFNLESCVLDVTRDLAIPKELQELQEAAG